MNSNLLNLDHSIINKPVVTKNGFVEESSQLPSFFIPVKMEIEELPGDTLRLKFMYSDETNEKLTDGDISSWAKVYSGKTSGRVYIIDLHVEESGDHTVFHVKKGKPDFELYADRFISDFSSYKNSHRGLADNSFAATKSIFEHYKDKVFEHHFAI